MNLATSRNTAPPTPEEEPPGLPVPRAQEIKGLLEEADKMYKEAGRTLHRASTRKAKHIGFRSNSLKSMRRNAENELAEGEFLKETALELRREAKKLQRDAIALPEANRDKPESALDRDFGARSGTDGGRG